MLFAEGILIVWPLVSALKKNADVVNFASVIEIMSDQNTDQYTSRQYITPIGGTFPFQF
jgi:hypothetical protein